MQLGQGNDPGNYKELLDEQLQVATNGANLEHIEWTADGQILTLASDGGVVYNFLASLPVLAATHGARYMYLTSLLELSVFDSSNPEAPPMEVQISMEPTFVALGPSHVAYGMNNHVLFHHLNAEAGCPLAKEKEYLGSVEAIKLNQDFVAVLSEGRVSLDSLAEDDGSGQNVISRTFPESREFKDVTCLAMTRDFLIYGTGRGIITMVYLPELATVCDFRHELPIISVFPNQLGTRIAFIDEQGQGFLLLSRSMTGSSLCRSCQTNATASYGIVWIGASSSRLDLRRSRCITTPRTQSKEPASSRSQRDYASRRPISRPSCSRPAPHTARSQTAQRSQGRPADPRCDRRG